MRRAGDQVQVNVQLIDAESGAHVWADRFDTDRANLAEAQSEITGRLARTLNLELVEAAGRRIEQEKAVDPDARDLVMRGWAWFYRPDSVANQQEAQRIFERALEMDPRSVDARIGIARVLACECRPTDGAARVSKIKRAPNSCSSKLSSAIRTARWRILRWGCSAGFRTD